ncbi:MAG: hypothetical protein Q9200_000866 [Gallowayella weberi]
MEPIGLTASLAHLITITVKTIKYLNSVKDASSDRASLFHEVSNLLPLLVKLQAQINEAKQSEPWFDCVRSLGVENGPLDQLRDALVQLTKKLKPKQGVEKAARAFIWTFDKAYCETVLQKIERVKSRTSLALQGDTFKLAQAIKTDTAGIHTNVAAVADGIEAIQLSEEVEKRRGILAWFSPLNFSKTQQDVFARREDGTGQWFLDSPNFQDWVSGSTRTLCCPGIPGAGKTILAAVVVDTLRNEFAHNPSKGVAAVYCNFKEREIQGLQNLLAGACAQLIQGSTHPLPDDLTSLHKRHHTSGTKPGLDEVNHIFDVVVRRHSTVFVVIDALDECSERVRDAIVTRLNCLPDSVRFLITTRPIGEITDRFPNSPKIEIRATNTDLMSYITSRIANSTRLSSLIRDRSTLREDICTHVIAKADGMFLAAKLHVDSLASKTSIKTLKKALDRLSGTLHDLYHDALQRIDSQSHDDKALAEKALRWVAYAYRPLGAPALQEALAIDSEETDYDPEAIPPVSLILDVCAGLLIVDEEAGVVRLVHYTAQDYFDALAESRFIDAHSSIAGECITYLDYDTFQKRKGSDDQIDLINLHFENHLLRYASAFWAHHAKSRPHEPATGLGIRINEFLKSNPHIWLLTKREYNTDYFRFYFEKDLQACAGHGVAAFFGLCDHLRNLLNYVDNINARAKHCSLDSPLHLAAYNDQATAIQVLLDHGADIECRDSHYRRTPLLVAVIEGAVGAATMLVDEGADVRAVDEYDRTPIALIRWTSPIPFIKLLHNAGAIIREQEIFSGNRLMSSVIRNDDIETLRWLFDHATLDANVKPIQSAALVEAVSAGRMEIIEMLRKYGADVNSRHITNYTCLHNACGSNSSNRLIVTEYLIEHGAELDAQDPAGRTALHIAASKGHVDVALALLHHNAAIDITDSYGSTPMHNVCAMGSLALAEELVRRDVTVDTRSNYTLAALYSNSEEDLGYIYTNHIVIDVDCGNSIRAKLIAPQRALSEELHALYLWKLLHRDKVLEWRVWPEGMTALDIAVLRNDEDIIRVLKPMTKSTEETIVPTVDQYLCELFQVSSFGEVLDKL